MWPIHAEGAEMVKTQRTRRLAVLLVSFGIGCRCFYDFDRGLKTAKTTGQSRHFCKLFAALSLCRLNTSLTRHSSDTPLFRRGGSSTLSGSKESKHPYGGEPLEPRMSIE